MVPELEKPRVTEIQLRMDCNGCVQKIKKALHGINGIYDLYIDVPQQKITIIGWADPEKILKAIRKTRKIATICSHTEPTEPPPAQPPEQAPPEGGAPPPETANQPPGEAPPPPEASPPAEPPKDPPPPENPQPGVTPPPAATDSNAGQPAQPSGPKDVGEVHVIYHHPPDYGYRYGYSHGYGGHSYTGHWNRHPGQGFPHEPPQPIHEPPQPIHEPPQPIHVSHSYNTYKPSPYVTEYANTYKPSPYVTEYAYLHSPPRHTHYSRMDHYSEDYHSTTNGNGNITSMFSDENPNACTIV